MVSCRTAQGWIDEGQERGEKTRAGAGPGRVYESMNKTRRLAGDRARVQTGSEAWRIWRRRVEQERAGSVTGSEQAPRLHVPGGTLGAASWGRWTSAIAALPRAQMLLPGPFRRGEPHLPLSYRPAPLEPQALPKNSPTALKPWNMSGGSAARSGL
ncbi:hypothetical protein Micbo1qcDRAFT_45177 [Microdochium bolleyi]|uniref:Uncharacterized protein n=1 Tax=Microdochium bolleyi TaxID=196109 RepID=A0A136JBT5_9PEZI|nr:hypothetical protein Micbo1qcDRAFT_45177 [Microdochium bolleyi]